MPYGTSLKAAVEEVRLSPHRSLILIDKVVQPTCVWGYFDHLYDIQPMQVSLDQFLHAKMLLGAGAETTIFTAEMIPILHHLSGWKTTIVIRNPQDRMDYINGEGHPLSYYMGLE